jgi:hypothetical protein
MTTIRVKKDAKYFAASNEPFNDKRLSWEARGLMGYLLSKPNNWKIRMADLDRQGPAGGRKLKRMLSELRLYGYMNRIRVKLENGKFDWITDVYESPSQNPNPTKGIIKTSVSKRTTAKRTSAKKPDIVKTKESNTDTPSSEGAGATPAAEPQPTKAQDFPSNVLFREVVGRWPAKGMWHKILHSVSLVEKRLLRPATKEDLQPFYEEWLERGYMQTSFKWLTEWAVSGVIPSNGKKSAFNVGDALRSMMQEEPAYGNA